MIHTAQFLYIFATLVVATLAFPTSSHEDSPGADLALLLPSKGSTTRDTTVRQLRVRCVTCDFLERQPTKPPFVSKHEEVTSTYTANLKKQLAAGHVITDVSLHQAAVPGSGVKRHQDGAPMTDLVKRQPPGKVQDLYLNVVALHAVHVTLHFVWDCINARFIAATSGAGRPRNRVITNPVNGQGEYGLTMGPMGQGNIRPNELHNPSRTFWQFDSQVIEARFQGTVDDDNAVVLSEGSWVNPAVGSGGLTATNLNTHETIPVQIQSFVLTPAEYDDSSDPPKAEGSGFNGPYDLSAPIP